MCHLTNWLSFKLVYNTLSFYYKQQNCENLSFKLSLNIMLSYITSKALAKI